MTNKPNKGLLNKARTFLKNFITTQVPEITKYGKKSDSSKQSDFKVSTKIIQDFFFSDPTIRQALQTNVDNVCTEYFFEKDEDTPEAEEQAKQAEKIFYRDNFMEKWRNLQLCEEIWDDSYQEVQVYLQDGEAVFDSYILDTPSITIKNNKDGGIDKYIQRLQGKVVAELEPENIIHYRFNALGDRDYGLSMVSTILFSAAIRKFIEKFNASIFMNHKPRGAWTFPEDMSVDDYNMNVDMIIEAKNNPNKDIFLRGSGIDFKNFLDQKDVDFMKGYIEARNEIIIGLGVPPIMLGLPEGSNRSNSDVQLQAYDRRVRAKQNSFAYKINTELLPKLGLDKIKFRIVKTSKRDEERELNIVNKMAGLITLNEARKEIGFPELDPAEFPEAEQIWTKSSGGLFGPSPDQPQPEMKIEKSVKLKKNVKSPLVTLKQEAKVLKPFKQFFDTIFQEAKREVDFLVTKGRYKKALDSEDLIQRLQATFDKTGLSATFATFAAEQYLTVGQKLSSKVGVSFEPNKEELEFLRSYNLDLVKASGQREISKIKQILDIGLVNNQTSRAIKQALDKERKTALGHTQTLIRTELNRANNMGSMTAMKQAGVETKKYILVVEDERTSGICGAMNKKYGSESQAIPLDKEFKIIANKKSISQLSPPFHPNCRSQLAYTIA